MHFLIGRHGFSGLGGVFVVRCRVEFVWHDTGLRPNNASGTTSFPRVKVPQVTVRVANNLVFESISCCIRNRTDHISKRA